MSQAEALLNSLADEPDIGTVAEVDTREFFIINAETRTIHKPSGFVALGVESDEKTNRIWFKCPRIVGDNVDLTTYDCTIDYKNASGAEDRYIIEDLTVDGEYIIFSWKLERKVTYSKGDVEFKFNAEIVNTDTGETLNEWNTTSCFCPVLKGLEVKDVEPLPKNYDAVDQLLRITNETVDTVRTTGESAVEDVENTRKDVISAVENTGENAVNDVNAAKEAALAHIGDGVDNTLTRENVAADAKATGDAILKYAIKPTSQGSLHALSDSAEQPLQGMKIFGKTEQFTTTGKSLLNTRLWETEKTKNGVTVRYLPDEDCFLLNGTVQGSDNIYTVDCNLPVEINSQYTLLSKYVSGSVSGEGYKAFYLAVADDLSGTFENWETVNIHESMSKTVIPKKQYIKKAWFYCSTGVTLTNLKVKLMLSKGTDTTYEPYTGGMPSPNPSYPQALESVGDDGSVEQFVCGQNLIDYTKCKGITENDKSFILDGDTFVFPAGKTYFGLDLSNAVRLVKGQTYRTFYKAVTSYAYPEMKITYVDGTYISRSSNKVITIDKDVKAIVFYIGANTLAETDFTLSKLQIKAGDIDNGYEYPKQPQSLTISTPNGLPGIPVSSGGNYTDENGQQYVSDYKDYKRMVYVQRVKFDYLSSPHTIGQHNNGVRYVVISSNGGATSANTPIMCNQYIGGVWSNIANHIYIASGGSIVVTDNRFTDLATAKEIISTEKPIAMYPLAEPIETPLSDEEIVAYKALHTNYPNTTIYNDDGAYTEVKYVADTKNYVDQKIAELVSGN